MDQKEFTKQQQEATHLVEDGVRNAVTILSQEIVSQEANSQKILPKKAYAERVHKEIQRDVEAFKHRIEKGSLELFKAVQEVAKNQPHLFTDEVHQDIAKLTDLAAVALQLLERYFYAFPEDNNVQEICQISDATINVLYLAAKHLYDQQHYEEAACAFQVLTLINDKQPFFWLVLGNCEFFCHRYQPALVAYALAGYNDPFDPTSFLYSCKCYEELGETENAINSLDLALIAIGDDKTQASLKQKIQLERQRLMIQGEQR